MYNKELRRAVLLWLSLTAPLCVLGFRLTPAAGWMALAASLTVGGLFLDLTVWRYRRIAALTERIDRVLHGEEDISFDRLEEGELSLLDDEIAKMTLRIREQNESLRRERQYLADSLADIAHQLRTPLTGLSLSLTLLREAEEETERLARIRESAGLCRRMENMVEALLKLSRLDADTVQFARETVPMEALLTEAAEPLGISMELRGVTLHSELQPGAAVTGDRVWLAEALRNILKNAMEASPEGGVITVTGQENPLYGEITVADQGTGIPEEELPHIFERFYRGSVSGNGNGIGLSLARSIVARQDGTLTARNQRQGGAVFTFRFPK